MKVIDLLNKIANGEEVLKFEYYGGTYIYDKETRKYRFRDMWFDFDIDNLNDDIEIIEDKMIEKSTKIDRNIKWYLIEENEKEKTKIAQINVNFSYIREKLLEIIDHINMENKR